MANTNNTAIGSHNVIVSTTCPSGYTLSIETDHDGKIYRNADTSSEHYLSSTTGTIDNPIELGNNQWGFSLTDPSTNNNNFSAVPTTKTDIKTTNPGTATPPEGDKTPIYYGVKTDGTLASGHYNGTVIYSISPNTTCFTYTITFNTNNGGTIEPKTLNFGETLDLADISSKVSKTGYKLTGWKDQAGNTYGTTGQVNLNETGASASIVLTAQWQENSFWTIQYMQDMTSDICASATTPSTSATTSDTTGAYAGNKSYVPQRTLSDIRDNEIYVIRKLADGNCWMVENLRLGSPSMSYNLDSATSDLSGGRTFTLPKAQTVGGVRWASSWTDQNDADTPRVYLSSNRQHGGYYNWYTSTAGSGLYSMTSGHANQSICPKSWKLPEGGDSSTIRSFRNLILTYNASSNTVSINWPINIALSSDYNPLSGAPESQVGTNGYYWSSTAQSNAYAYDLGVVNRSTVTGANYTNYNYKVWGLTVRCVAR